jgi:alpha-ribazole phosphatase
MQQFTLYFMRHGQTTRNNHLLGRTNVPLSADGWQQMSDSLAKTIQFDRIITSPLIRCHQFACDYATSIDKPLLVDSNLQELDFGTWDGQSYQALWQQPNPELTAFYQDPWQQTPPNGESVVDFCLRVDLAWQDLLQRRGTSLVICHGGVIRYLMAKILGMPLPGTRHLTALDIPHAALIKISITIDDNGIVWPTIHWR